MKNTIFSTYKQGENRVTGTLLAVLRQLSVDNMNRLLGSLIWKDEEAELIEFVNQRSAGGDGVPDALITSNLDVVIETKTESNRVDKNQLLRHMDRLHSSSPYECLLVITPDMTYPSVVRELDGSSDKSVLWVSFSEVSELIDSLASDEKNVLSEREIFVLRQFQMMLDNDGLLAPEEDTVIVAARHAWNVYLKTGVYACQSGRSFREVDFIGFYSGGKIQTRVAKVKSCDDHVLLLSGENEGELGEAVDRLLVECPNLEGLTQKIFILSEAESNGTTTLNSEIKDDKKSRSGKVTAFTMGQRYVSIKQLGLAETTSDLDSPVASKAA